MRLLLALFILLSPAPSLRADGAAAPTAVATVTASDAVAAAVPAAGGRKVSAGLAYGVNSFAGLALGALVGAAGGAIPYARDRQGQDPSTVILGAVYGSVAGAVGLGLPASAYEVASDKPGAGITMLYDSFGFAVLGGAVGAGAGMLSYRHKVDTQPDSAEDFLAAAAAGVCGGAALGLGVGIYEAVLWPGHAPKIPGKGVHASAGLLAFSPVLETPQGLMRLPNATLLKVDF
jgi:hypothetical protein